MAQFNFTVDTEPMAISVDGVSERLTATTAAVTAMQAAVIATEKKAAESICENVDRGFYSLIQSQVSSKVAKCFTDMNVTLSLILEHSKSLAATQTRMESDYNRTRREYLKIFHSLDKALENRVAQLDKEAMKLADSRKRIITDRALKDAAVTASSTKEISTTRQTAVSARIKSKTSKALTFFASRIHENLDYGTQMNAILDKADSDKPTEEYVPVIVIKEKSLVLQGTEVTQIYYPEAIDENAKNRIELAIMNNLDSDLNLVTSVSEFQEIYKEFNHMVAESGLEPRVAETMIRLFNEGE